MLTSLSSRRVLAMACWHRSWRLDTRCSTRTTYRAGPEAISSRESRWPQQMEMMGRCQEKGGKGQLNLLQEISSSDSFDNVGFSKDSKEYQLCMNWVLKAGVTNSGHTHRYFLHSAGHLDPQITQCCSNELQGDEEVNHVTFFNQFFQETAFQGQTNNGCGAPDMNPGTNPPL